MAKEKKKKSSDDLTVMSLKELSAVVGNMREEARKVRFDKALGVGTNPLLLKKTKKRIAQILTVMNMKKMEGVHE